jgi:hypothetical protein
LHARRAGGRIDFVSAEHLIALEAALAELGALYTAARTFTPLAEAAERELLPQLSTFSSHLRALNRSGEMAQDDVDAASQRILDLRTAWRGRLDGVRSSSTYRQTADALRRDEQSALAVLIPQLFARLEVAQPPARLYFAISAAVRRRGAGSSPFLSPAECADKIGAAVRDGLRPFTHGGEFWDEDLPSLPGAASFADIDSPFAVSVAGAALKVTVFADDSDLGYRVFAPRLSGELSVAIAAEADDEWWQAFEQSYREFRDELCAELTRRAIDHAVVDRESLRLV